MHFNEVPRPRTHIARIYSSRTKRWRPCSSEGGLSRPKKEVGPTFRM